MVPRLISILFKSLSLLLLCGVLAAEALAQVGTIQFVAGDVRIRNAAGVERVAQKGGTLAEGDTIITGAGASAQLKMVDEGVIAVRSNSELKLDQYTYKGKADGSERAFMSLVKGGFRTITGLIGRTNRANYRVSTPTATIGIRGTDFEPFYVTEEIRPGQPVGSAPSSRTQLAQANVPVEVQVDVLDGPTVLAQAGPGGAKPPAIPLNATLAKVNSGIIGMSVPKVPTSLLVVGANQAGMATPDGKLSIIPIPTEIFRATPQPGTKPAAKPAADKPAADKPAVAEKPAADKPAADKPAVAAAPADKPAAAPPPPAEKPAAAPPLPTETLAATPAPSVAAEPSPVSDVRATTTVDTIAPTTTVAPTTTTLDTVTTVTTTTTTSTTATTTTTTNTITQPITLESSTGLDVNLTTQNVTTSTGSTAPIDQGTFALQAQASADAALASANALNALVTSVGTLVAGTGVSLAISNVSSSITSAQSAVTSALALTINSATASSEAAASASAATTALSLTSSAITAFTANGAFVDSTAKTAASALTAANTALQSANTSAQSNLTTVNTSVTALTTAQQAANSAITSANAALSAANSLLTMLTSAGLQSSTASAQLTIAQNSASLAQSEASAALADQNAGNFTGAQQHALNAGMHAAAAAGALSAAQQIVSGVTSANAAGTSALTASTEATNAQSAASTGASAASAITTDLATVNANAPIVATNAPLTAFNNPAVASTAFTHLVHSQKPVTGGTEEIAAPLSSSLTQSNTKYVLDGNKDLVEIRHTDYFDTASPTPHSLSDADVKFSGGTRLDHFHDPEGTAYLGRIQGGQIDVTDNTGVVAPFSAAQGPASTHWLVALTPGNSPTFSNSIFGPVNNVQTLVGTANYSTIFAATHPTDKAGNVGTLDSASVTANFTAQTVQASLGISFSGSRNTTISATTLQEPIHDGHGFSGFVAAPGEFPAGSAGTLTCSGNCPTNPFHGVIIGGFGGTASGGTTTGAVSNKVGLGYDIFAFPSASSIAEDVIQGVAILSTGATQVFGTAPTFANNSNVRHEVRYSVNADPAPSGSGGTFTTVIRNSINLTNPTAQTLSGPTTSTNYLFDAASNLVRIFDTPYVVFDHGTNVAQFADSFEVFDQPRSNTMVSFGGTPVETFSDAAGNNRIRMGRYSGGSVTVHEPFEPGGAFGVLDPLGNRSAHWVVYQGPTSLPTTGTFHYTRLDSSGNLATSPSAASFATSPTDSYGNVGTLDRARLTANFDTMKVSAGVAITMPSGPGGSLGTQNLAGTFFDAPLTTSGFNVSSGASENPTGTDRFNISCFGTGCAPNQSYGGRIRGSMTGTAGDGGFFRYTFNTNYATAADAAANGGRVFNDYMDGMVAFGKNVNAQIVAPSTSPTAGPSEVLAAYTYQFTGECFGPCLVSNTPRFSIENPANLTLDGSGNLLSAFEPAESGHDHNENLILTSGTASPASPLSGGNGITLGWWSNSPTLTVSGEDFSGTFTNRVVQGDGLAWVRGPAVFPFYLPGAIATISNSAGTVVSGTANFTLTNSIVRDQNGAGATGPVTAGLKADFNKQAVGFDMTVPTAAGTWAAFNNGTAHGGTIVANVRMDDGGGFNAMTSAEDTTPTGINTHRQMTVQLSNSGACLTFPCSGFGNVQGQLMGEGINGAGMTFTFFSGSTDRVLGALAFNNPTPFSAETPYHLIGAVTGMNPLGQFDEEENTPIRGGFVSRSRTQFVDGLPVRVDSNFPVIAVPTGCTTCTSSNTEVPAVFAITGATGVASIGNAQIFNSGYDPATGLRWGRYGGPGSASGAFIGVTDRITGSALPSIDVGPNTQGVHFIATGTQSGPTVLPISGTFNYTRVGNTNPTDNFGNIGTLNSATLTANFGAQTVSSGVNVSIAGSTWDASASSVPIQRGVFFEAAKNLDGTGSLAVTKNGSGSGTAGRLVGAFGGQTGVGAAVLYSLNQGGNTATNPSATTVSGVVGFKR